MTSKCIGCSSTTHTFKAVRVKGAIVAILFICEECSPKAKSWVKDVFNAAKCYYDILLHEETVAPWEAS